MSQPEASKPEIVTMSTGAHNEALMEGRLTHSNTFKRSRIVMIIPAIAPIDPKVYLSHRSLIFPPNQACLPMLLYGAEVGDAYSRGIEAILADPNLRDWEYILTIEADNIPPPDGVLKLIRRMEDNPQFAGIGGLYFCKGPAGPPHIWGDITDPNVNYRPVPPRPGELIECYGTSMGFNLWRMEMFRDARLPRPLFPTKASKDGVGTQDLAFWGEARKFGYRCAVDCGCPVGHIDISGSFGPKGFVW